MNKLSRNSPYSELISENSFHNHLQELPETVIYQSYLRVFSYTSQGIILTKLRFLIMNSLIYQIFSMSEPDLVKKVCVNIFSIQF